VVGLNNERAIAYRRKWFNVRDMQR
jgi:hypothetical protein